MTEHIVPDGVRRMPVAQYLRRAYPLLPGWVLREAFKRRGVRVNGDRCGSDAMTQARNVIRLYVDEKYLSGECAVLYEDGALLAVEKEAGLPVDVDQGGIGEDTVLARIRRAYPGARLCHRLDTGTGGVLIAALTDAAYERVLAAFKQGEVEKRYECIIKGTLEPVQSVLRGYLRKDASTSHVTIYDQPVHGALEIETRYRMIESYDDASRLEVDLITGRTHQIRAHLAHIGHPVAGDDKYGDRAFNREIGAKYPLLWCTRMVIFGEEICSEAKF